MLDKSWSASKRLNRVYLISEIRDEKKNIDVRKTRSQVRNIKKSCVSNIKHILDWRGFSGFYEWD